LTAQVRCDVIRARYTAAEDDRMPTTHQVQQGECLVSIAESYGFFWETLWNLPENKAIREARRDPTVLLPGDVVTIPEKTVKEYVRPTGARHTFRVKNIPAKLNLRLHDEGGEPRANLAYVLTIDGVETRGSTDGEGAVRVPIPPQARRGTLLLVESGEGGVDVTDPQEQRRSVFSGTYDATTVWMNEHAHALIDGRVAKGD